MPDERRMRATAGLQRYMAACLDPALNLFGCNATYRQFTRALDAAIALHERYLETRDPSAPFDDQMAEYLFAAHMIGTLRTAKVRAEPYLALLRDQAAVPEAAAVPVLDESMTANLTRARQQICEAFPELEQNEQHRPRRRMN